MLTFSEFIDAITDESILIPNLDISDPDSIELAYSNYISDLEDHAYSQHMDSQLDIL